MLKVEHSINYLNKKKADSEILGEIQYVKQLNSQIRSKRSDDSLKLPGNFKVGQAIGGGDCFFDSVAQGLKRLKPEMDFTVKSLREACKKFAQSQLENDQSWLKEALKNENEQINEYIPRIEFAANDIEQKSRLINVFGLTSPIWGRSEIEGRIICKEYNVKLHIIEKHVVVEEVDKELWIHQIVNSEGSRSVGSMDYNEGNTIHIINRGNLHFEPILGTQETQYNRQQSSNHDTPKEELKIPTKEKPKKKSQDSEQQSPGLSAGRIKKVANDPNQADSSQQSSNNRQSVRGNQPIDSAQHQQINPNSPDFIDSDDEREKNTELFSAIRTGDLQKVEELLKAGVKVDIINKNNKDNTPLHYAIEREKKEIAEKLLQEWKADINAKNNKGDTPLHIATSKGNRKLVQLLVSKNANTDIKNNEDRTPLDTAKHLKRQDIVQILEPQIQPSLKASVGDNQQIGSSVQQRSNLLEQVIRPKIPIHKVQKSDKVDDRDIKRPGKQGLHGEIYQLKLLMLFLKRGMDNQYSFRLSTEKKEAKKFDDLFFEITRDGKKEYRLLQAKHKDDESKKITFDNLLTESDSDYSRVIRSRDFVMVKFHLP